MKFAPKTDKEIAEANLWQPANYSFEIIEATDRVSKSGNDMIELKLKVFNNEGSYIFVNDYLLESMAYKLKHAADVCGLSDQYLAGSLVGMDFVGKSGTVKLKIQKSKDAAYADKNVIGDYVVNRDEHTALLNGTPASSEPRNVMDDTIPF